MNRTNVAQRESVVVQTWNPVSVIVRVAGPLRSPASDSIFSYRLKSPQPSRSRTSPFLTIRATTGGLHVPLLTDCFGGNNGSFIRPVTARSSYRHLHFVTSNGPLGEDHHVTKPISYPCVPGRDGASGACLRRAALALSAGVPRATAAQRPTWRLSDDLEVGKQYVAVPVGPSLIGNRVIQQLTPEIPAPSSGSTLLVFALADEQLR